MSIVNKLSNIKLDSSLKSPANIPSSNKFQNTLDSKADAMMSGVNDFITQMKQADVEMNQKLATLGDSKFKTLFELQRSMQSIHLKTEIITKSGEAVLSGIKRVQQMGAS